MKLFWSPRSPFARKAAIVLHETGQYGDVELVPVTVASYLPTDAAVLAVNPLGKIPALVLADGSALFDSRVICEHLDLIAGGALFPADSQIRMRQLCWQALGDGLVDILLAWRTELLREGGAWPALCSGWLEKTRLTMSRLEAEANDIARLPFGIGHIAIICALGQLDFRWPDCGWRDHFPALADFEREMSRRASVAKTAPPIESDTASAPTAGHLHFSS